jgi:hypothetical protein
MRNADLFVAVHLEDPVHISRRNRAHVASQLRLMSQYINSVRISVKLELLEGQTSPSLKAGRTPAHGFGGCGGMKRFAPAVEAP